MKLGKAFLLVFLLFLFQPLINQPIICAADPPSDSVWIVAPDSAVAGKSFSIPVYVSNSKVLMRIVMNFAFKLSSVVRLDTISFSDTSCLLYNSPIFDHRKLFRIAPDTIKLEFWDSTGQDYLPIGSGKIVDLRLFGIRDTVFFISAGTIQYWTTMGPVIQPAFSTDSVWLRYTQDPPNPDSFWVKKGTVVDTIGINAKFPLPLTAYNDEVLSGFQVPLLITLITGKKVPTFYKVSFENTNLNPADTNLLSRKVSSFGDTSVLIKLELKKELTETLLDTVKTGEVNQLFDLWLKADSFAGRCSIDPAFIPGFGPLFFINSVGGFIPSHSVFACTTFSYTKGDISKNGVVNNVDLFYLAKYLFDRPAKISNSELKYTPEDINRIASQRVFQFTPISSEEWDSTFTQILFRGDVNGDGRVDAGDYYKLARKLQLRDSLYFGWEDPKTVGSCGSDYVRINFQKAYAGQKIPILIEIYNHDSLAGLTIPLHILDTSKIVCDFITLAGKFDTLNFDWEWLAWDVDYDQDSIDQDLLITLSTLGDATFRHIPASVGGKADSAFILWCTVKKNLLSDTSYYIDSASLLPSHKMSFFQRVMGYSCVPQLKKVFVPTEFADYGDAPDGTNPYFAGDSFPTLYNTNFSRIPGRRGPYHQDSTITEWLGPKDALLNVTREWNAKIIDRLQDSLNDEDNLGDTLFVGGGNMAWYIVPVTVDKDFDTFRYLNVLYDTSGNRKWENEWVVRNKLIIPTDTTQRIIIGPFLINQKPDTIPTWARFTLTRDSIPAQEFGTLGWDGSGPDTGWTYGETEDILFNHTNPTGFECFSVNLDSSYYSVPASGRTVHVTVKLVSSPGSIDGLTLKPQVFDSSGKGDAIETNFKSSLPLGYKPDSPFSLERLKDQIIFVYYVKFPDGADKRKSRVLWKVSKDSGPGTKLVATYETEFEESAKPRFLISPFKDTISYYGGVVDFSFRVVDPDNDYPVKVTFERKAFEGSKVVYPPTFGVLNDTTKLFYQAATDTHQIDILDVRDSTDILIFHWAADSTEIGSRSIKLVATDSTKDSVDTSLIVYVSSDSSLLPPEKGKVWIGRTGLVALYGKVPVEVYNRDTLYGIVLPLKITGPVDSLLGWSWGDSTYRLWDNSVLEKRRPDPFPRIGSPTAVTCSLIFTSGGKPLEFGYGTIFDLNFWGNRTSFQIDTLSGIKFFKDVNLTIWVTPDFESYEIRAIEKGVMHGDANGDGKRTVADVVYTINYLFKGGLSPVPALEAGDANCDGKVTVADAVYLVNHLFKGGPMPPC